MSDTKPTFRAPHGQPTGQQAPALLASSSVAHVEAYLDESNSLLRALPPEAYTEFLARSQMVPLELRDILIEPNALVDYVYFPQTGILSTVVVLKNNARVEVVTVGREGMAPVTAAWGGTQAPMETVVQLNGVARRIAFEDFQAIATPGSALHDLIQRYAQFTFAQAAQAVACNRLHSVEQRCARWLLITHDRVDGDTFGLTHEFLAVMLGVRRAGVSVAAEALQGAGLIRYTRGRITVLDRAGLEAAACECYAAVRAESERLLIVGDTTGGSGQTTESQDVTASGEVWTALGTESADGSVTATVGDQPR